MVTAVAQLLIDWDNDGTAETSSVARLLGASKTEGAEDVSMNLLAREPLVVRRGRDLNRVLSPMQASSIEALLKNLDKVYSRENASGPLAGKIKPGLLTRCRAGYSGSIYNLFTGLLSRPRERSEFSERSVEIRAWDRLTSLVNKKIDTALYQNIRVDTAIGYVLDAAGWPAADRDLDIAQTTMDWWWTHSEIDRRDAFDYLIELETTEGPGARIFVAGNGKLTFHSRHHRLTAARSTAVQATFRGSGAEPRHSQPFRYEYRDDNVIRRCLVTVKTRSAKALAEVWALGETISLAPNEVRNLDARHVDGDPFTAAVAPVQGHDFNDSDIVGDSFTRGNSSTTLGTPTTGPAWSAVVGTWGIASNTGYLATSGGALNLATLEAGFGITVVAKVTLSTVATGAGLAFRATDIENYWRLVAQASDYALIRRSGGADTTIGTGGSTPANGDVLLVVLAGTSITCYVNGTQVASTTSSVNQAVTKHGLAATSGATAARFDSFSVQHRTTVALDRTSGASCKITLTASANGAQVLTGLRLRAQLVSVDNTNQVRNSIADGVGPEDYPYAARAEIDMAMAQDFANAIVALYGAARPISSMTLVANVHADRMAQALGLEISDRIAIEDSQSGLTTSSEFFVESIEHRFSGGPLLTALVGAEVADTTPYWILGTSELGIDTRLGY